MTLESEINRLKAKIDVPIDVTSEDWLYIKIHIFLMIFELTFVLFLCLVFYFMFKRVFSLSRKSNILNHFIALNDEKKLIALSNVQNNVSTFFYYLHI